MDNVPAAAWRPDPSTCLLVSSASPLAPSQSKTLKATPRLNTGLTTKIAAWKQEDLERLESQRQVTGREQERCPVESPRTPWNGFMESSNGSRPRDTWFGFLPAWVPIVGQLIPRQVADLAHPKSQKQAVGPQRPKASYGPKSKGAHYYTIGNPCCLFSARQANFSMHMIN